MQQTLRRWKVIYELGPWPSRRKQITVEATSPCGARGVAAQELAKKHSLKNIRLLRKTTLA